MMTMYLWNQIVFVYKNITEPEDWSFAFHQECVSILLVFVIQDFLGILQYPILLQVRGGFWHFTRMYVFKSEIYVD